MSNEPFKVVVWGDSIAAGNDEMKWPAIAEQILAAVINTGRTVEVVNEAVCGMPACNARHEFDERIAPHNPDLVIIQFGFNDCRHDGSRGELPLATPDEFADSLRAMIKDCREKASAEVCLFGNHRPRGNLIMPTGLTYIETWKKYKKVVCKVAEETGSRYYDMSKAVAESEFSHKKIVCNDGVHLSKTGYNFYGCFAAGVINTFVVGK